ncbi:MAG TPA: hypothetical protein VFX97_17960 [Pyrinomonadaceae bacterium]|nr:hypothetical protein [Pyrinomonadaceae bacterium]
MKQTPTLTVVLILLILDASGAAAQRRGAISAEVKKVEKATAIKVADIAASTGTPPRIISTAGGTVSDINAVDGTNSNPHTPKYLGGMTMNFDGIALGANDTLYALTSASLTNGYKSYIFVIGPNYGVNRFENLLYGTPLYMAGNRWYCLGEGDLAYDKGGSLYASCKDGSGWKLVTINPASGVVAIVGSMPSGGSFSALAFNPAGELFALDTNSRKLWKLDKTNPSNNPQAIPLTVAGGQQMPNTSTQGGMGFTANGGLYAAFGGQLVIINPVNGALSIVTSNSGGYTSGLAISGGSGPIKHN